MANKIQLRRDTSANWTRVNPILADGEPGVDITNKKIKYGDGSTAWRDLAYASGAATPTGDPTQLVNGAYELTLDVEGFLVLPGNSTILDGMDTIRLTPAGVADTNQALWIYGTNAEGNHLHLTTGGANTELYLGNDIFYVKLANTGSVVIQSDDGLGNTSSWTFSAPGVLTLPGEIRSTANIGDVTVTASDMANSFTWTFAGNGGIQTPILTAAPGTPIAGTIYTADGVTWDPDDKYGAVPYPVFYDGATYNALY